MPLPKHSEVLVNAKANARAASMVDQIEKDYQAEIRDSIMTAINDGLTVSDWADSFNAINERFGLGTGDASALTTTFRTVQASVYSGGKFTDMMSEAGVARAPYWMFSAIEDDRIDDECAELDEQIFDKTDLDAQDYWPPIHFCCRCSVIELDETDAEGQPISTGNTTDVAIDDSWSNELLKG